ncbi:hypothetical protein [Pedobacter sp. Hv1]|uniref:hypothetical protein n=1 Tax=Pedobacter sp. Hv1 TaxID=1740090 RepID=UPI000A55965D|nr:hypothetical protein [Pedobacter sp. Hv1]
MEVHKPADLINFLRSHIEPLEDEIYGTSFRASVYLHDGTFIPCVVFRDFELVTSLAIKRFTAGQAEKCGTVKKAGGTGYVNMVKHYLLNNSRIRLSEIGRIEKSKFAIPSKFLQQIEVETSKGWTGFTCKMNDGKYLGFGTTYAFEFFYMPSNYSLNDITAIINHSYVLKNGELKYHPQPMLAYPSDYNEAVVNREMSFFECFIDRI